MEPLPHHYTVTVAGTPEGHLEARGENVPVLQVAPPLQFGGTGGFWSPEDLLVAAVANCFVLSFRAVTQGSRFEWISLECASEGVLDKVERTMKFTEIVTRVKLVLPAGADAEKAESLLAKAEKVCLVSNSLNCECHLEVDIQFKS